MSFAASPASTYTRASILGWANAILEASYGSFQDIPRHEVGLLLYGIFNTSCTPQALPTRQDAQSSVGTAGASDSVPLLSDAELRQHAETHRQTCTRYLQFIQFPPTTKSRSASPAPTHLSSPATATPLADERSASLCGTGPAAAAAAVTVTQQRNAEHVLAMIRALSSEEAELLKSETCPAHQGSGPQTATAAAAAGSAQSTRLASGQASDGRGGNTANVVLLLGPTMTAAAWLNGGVFVEELKLWRWVRLMADRHHATPASIRDALRAYLQHGGCSPATAVRAEAPCVQKRARSPSQTPPEDTPAQPPHSPPPLQQQRRYDADTPTALDINEREGDHPEKAIPAPAVAQRAFTRSDGEQSSASEAYRGPLEQPSPTPTTASASTVTPLVGSISPVHALLSPIRDAERRERGNGVPSADRTGGTVPEIVKEAMAATATEFVQRSPQLQATLAAAQTVLQRTLTEAHEQQRSAALTGGNGDASNRSSGGAAAAGADGASSQTNAVQARMPPLPDIANGGDAQAELCRQRMVHHVFPSPSAVDAPSAGLTAPPSCSTCPAVMAHAIQCNLNAIDALEEARARAIAACLKKDPVALLAALQNVV